MMQLFKEYFQHLNQTRSPSNWITRYWYNIIENRITIDPNDDSVLYLPSNQTILNDKKVILIIRKCYNTIFQYSISMGENCHLLILGKAGVGKSTFIMWLLFEIWSKAKSNNTNIPSIVFVDRDGNKYWFNKHGCFNYNVNYHSKPDYYFSDSRDINEKDLANILCLVVSSENESETGYKQFTKRIKETSKGFTKYIPSMTLEDLSKAYPSIDEHIRNFRYDVVGGNPRHFNDSAKTPGMYIYRKIIEETITYYFGNNYIQVENSYDNSNSNNNSNSNSINCGTSHSLKKCSEWAINIISSALSKSGEEGKLECSSLFRQFDIDYECNPISHILSSTFIGILLEKMRQSRNNDIINVLRTIIGPSGIGFAFEYTAHQNIMNSNNLYSCIRLQPKHINEYNKTEIIQLSIEKKRKVLIRKVEDIQKLVVGDYGLPTIPNFPLVDGIIPPNIVLQMIDSKSYIGAIDKLSDIAFYLNKQVNQLIIVFVTTEQSLQHFEFVDELSNIKQYITLSIPSTEAAIIKLRRKNIMKRQRKDVKDNSSKTSKKRK